MFKFGCALYYSMARLGLLIWPWNYTVRTELDNYTGFIPPQLMTNISGCCYSL